jgi:hypothetical protein
MAKSKQKHFNKITGFPPARDNQPLAADFLAA